MKLILTLVVCSLLFVMSGTIVELFKINYDLNQSADFNKLKFIIRLVKDGRTFCTGTVINTTTVLTAAHCVIAPSPFGEIYINPTPIEIRENDNIPKNIYGTPTSIQTQLDRAIIKGDFSKLVAVKYISNISDLQKINGATNNLRACGYPLGGDLYCSSMQFLGQVGFMIKLKGLLLPGMSGAPVLLEDGTDIGINSAVYDDVSIVSFLYNIDYQIK